MKIRIDILNPEIFVTPNSDLTEIASASWHMRSKSYETDWMDDDIKNCTKGHTLDRLHIDDVQLTGLEQVQHVIEFLENAKKSFKS